MTISARERVLLLRAHRAGGLGESHSDAEVRILRRLATKGLVELARGFGSISANYALTAAGRLDVAHACVIETKPGRAPAPTVSRFTCSCGAVGDWTTTEGAHNSADDHRRLA